MRPRRLFAAALAAALAAAPARAAEIAVLSAGALRAVLAQVTQGFEARSGDRLRAAYATAGEVEKRLRAGAVADVVLVTKPRIESLLAAGKVVPGSIAVLGRSPLALCVRAGARKPDIATVAAVKQALLQAGSVAYTDPASGGTSGIHFTRELGRLGIADAIGRNAVLVRGENGAPPAVGAAVAAGKAELGIQPISELHDVAGIEIVGPLPPQMQTPDLTYAAGLVAGGQAPAAGRALIAFLAGPEGTAAVAATGMLPGDGR
jgi:molybdate transport system substrate-binding protein